MSEILLKPCTVFNGTRRLASGPLGEVALAFKRAVEKGGGDPVFLFDDATGRTFDIDIRGTFQEVLARLQRASPSSAGVGEARGPGRPKLGVVAREVTLLPRHWDWLNEQPGGASVALRKLVDEARRTSGDRTRTRAAQDAAYHFMQTMAGDWPDFEEATRALYAGDRARFATLVAKWPKDVRDHAVTLAFSDREARK
jgi:hypothetical protein